MSQKFIIGKKVGMTQLIIESGDVVPVTVIEAGPCSVVSVITKEKQSYEGILLGFGEKREKLYTKPELGFFKKKKMNPSAIIKEFRHQETEEKYKEGDILRVDIFEKNERVKIKGLTKGKGFTGTIKRWNFSRGPMTHGSKSHRITGSIGAGTTPGRVLKGKKMAGQMGNTYQSIKNLMIIDLDLERNLIFVKGAVPGSKNSIVFISSN